MQQDAEGFFYPKVNLQQCVKCGLCEKVCPVINKKNARYPLDNYAAKNKDEIVRKESSSGGIFSLLAEAVIEKKGVVFGASFDSDWMVVHSAAYTKDDLSKFRNSKYLQSQIKYVYRDVECLLRKNLLVLFSGTPCQVAGLLHFLCRDYPNLITVDFICHGTPSPGVWKKYIQDILFKFCKKNRNKMFSLNENISIKNIQFREKTNGWKNYNLVIEYEGTSLKKYKLSVFHKEDLYMKAFLRNYILRPSCYNCPAKSGSSYSDITLADFWDIEKVVPEYNDDKGVSSVMINTEKGRQLFSNVKERMILHPVSLEQATICNKGYFDSAECPPYRTLFWKKYRIFHKLNSFVLYQTIIEKIFLKIRRIWGA